MCDMMLAGVFTGALYELVLYELVYSQVHQIIPNHALCPLPSEKGATPAGLNNRAWKIAQFQSGLDCRCADFAQ